MEIIITGGYDKFKEREQVQVTLDQLLGLLLPTRRVFLRFVGSSFKEMVKIVTYWFKLHDTIIYDYILDTWCRNNKIADFFIRYDYKSKMQDEGN